MKRTLFFCILAIMAIALPASLSAGGKKAKATFSEYRYDFGNVKEKGGLVSHEFVFTNTGDGNLLIVDGISQTAHRPREEGKGKSDLQPCRTSRPH